MVNPFPSFQINPSQSLYLLGQKSRSPLFERYRQLMQACASHGEFLSFESVPEWLSCYDHDAQSLQTKLPLLVFRPHSMTSIAPFLHFCHQLLLPVIPRCGGTGVVGGCVPSAEGVILLTGHLKQMKNYDATQGIIDVEPGVTVRQLNRYVKADRWIFPLIMATEGVAGIAGCLSSQARGYAQQQHSLSDAVEQVTLVDGQGEILEVPAALVCGAEGLWGVIIELKLHLKPRPSHVQEFIYQGDWQEMLAFLPLLHSLQFLTCVMWFKNHFYMKLEGEEWRLKSEGAYLKQQIRELQPLLIPLQKVSQRFQPSRKLFVRITSVFNSGQLPTACQYSLNEAQHLQVECMQQADVLAGSLHLILQAEENAYLFAQKIAQFLVVWTDFVDRHQGVLASCHGVGLQMSPYMTPFWTEETQQIWRHLKTAFDPQGLFGKEHFFPRLGKSLEKVRHE